MSVSRENTLLNKRGFEKNTEGFTVEYSISQEGSWTEYNFTHNGYIFFYLETV